MHKIAVQSLLGEIYAFSSCQHSLLAALWNSIRRYYIDTVIPSIIYLHAMDASAIHPISMAQSSMRARRSRGRAFTSSGAYLASLSHDSSEKLGTSFMCLL